MRLHLPTKPTRPACLFRSDGARPGGPADNPGGVCQTAVMAENKTQATDASVQDFLDGVENATPGEAMACGFWPS